MTAPWNSYPVSQSYGVNGEQGIDIATPFHTPITNLYSGTVVQAQYGSAGGIVGILTTVPGLGKVVEYFLHLDLISVAKGQAINAGQVVGISGGENPGYPGGLHPASPQFSTGPHTEFGFFQGLPFQSQNAGNPAGYLHPSGKQSSTPPSSGAYPCPQMSFLDWFNPEKVAEWSACHAQQAANGVSATENVLSNPLGALFGSLFSGLATSLENLGFFLLALVFILIGVVLIAYEPAQQAVKDTVKGAFTA